MGRLVPPQGTAFAPSMTILVDTSVWSLALRRDAEASEPEVQVLKDSLLGNEVVVTTGLLLQELLQGFSRPKAPAQIIQRVLSESVRQTSSH